MFTRALVLLASLALPVTLTACGDDHDHGAEGHHDDGMTRSESGKYMIHPMAADWAPSTGDNTVRVHVMNAGGGVVATDFAVEPWMPHHGHGSSATPTATDLGNGGWEISNLVFTMPGAWELRITCTIDGSAERFVMPVTVK